MALRARSRCAIFSHYDGDSSYRKKWVVQESTEVFTLCDCDNITNSYLVHYKQKQIAVAIRQNAQCERAIIFPFDVEIYQFFFLEWQI